MGTVGRDIRRPSVGIVFAIAILTLVDSQGINDPQFKKPVPCEKLPNGNYVWGCSRFYAVCANHKEHSMYCYANLVLNPDNNQCDDPANVWACQNQNQRTPALYKAKEPFNCAIEPDGNYVVEQCSAYYYVCIGGNRLTQQCATGTVFNGEQRVCDHIADCKKTTVSHVKPVQLDELPPTDTPPSASTQSLYSAYSKVIAAPEVRRRSGNIYSRRQSFFHRRQNSGVPAYPPVADTFYVNGENIPNSYIDNKNGNFDGLAAPAPSSFAEFDCAGKSDGVYVTAGANACGQTFWKCVNGYAFEYTCPAGLYYDSPSVQCTQREFIVACGGTPQGTTTTIATFPPQDTFDCADKSEGIYETAPCSPTYAVCNGGVAWQMSCPAGLVFTKSSENCVFAAECSLSGISPTIAQQDTITRPKPQPPYGEQATEDSVQPKAQPPAEPAKTHQSIDSYGQVESDTSSTTTTTQILATTKAPFSCNGKPDGYYYKRKCQSSFIVCSKGHISHQKCPDGLLFDPFVANCQYVDICGKSTTTPSPTTTSAAPPILATTSKPDFDCSGLDNGYHVKQPCTSTFYSCSHSYTIQFTCPPLLVFDIDGKMCEYPNVCGTKTSTVALLADAIITMSSSSSSGNSEKAGPPALPSQNALTTSTVAPTPPPFDCSNKPDSDYAIAPCQNAYAICIHGKAIAAKCQANLVFDGFNGFCNYPRNCNPNAKPTTTALAPPLSKPKVPKALKNSKVEDAPAGPPAAPPTAYGYDAPLTPKASGQVKPKKQKKQFSCHGKPDGAYGTDCSSSYIRCWSNQTSNITCQDALVYDAKRKACVFKHECGKVKAENTLQSPYAIGTPSTTPAPAINYDCTSDGQFALGPCQNSYVVCSNGFPTKFICSDKLVFDSVNQMCAYVDDCEKTMTQSPVQHHEEKEVDETEPDDFVKSDALPYNTAASTSVPSASGKCNAIPVGTHAIGACSSEYISCYNGVVKVQTCSGGLIYSQEHAVCVTAVKVPDCTKAGDLTAAPTVATPSTAIPYAYGDVPQINQQTLKRRSSRY